MTIWFFLMSIFIGELLFYTWCRVQCVRSGYEITIEKNHHRNLLTVQKNLKIERTRLKSPERVIKIAKEQLGLTIPSSEQIMVIP